MALRSRPGVAVSFKDPASGKIFHPKPQGVRIRDVVEEYHCSSIIRDDDKDMSIVVASTSYQGMRQVPLPSDYL